MDYATKERLARTRDASDEAIATRLQAARRAVGLQQKDLARKLGVSATTYNSQEVRGRPSREAMLLFYREFRIDFNFVLHGDFAQLPGDVQEALFAALAAGEPSSSP
jgi:transcriptional regulator with XRE-family HTH domain